MTCEMGESAAKDMLKSSPPPSGGGYLNWEVGEYQFWDAHQTPNATFG